jgi:hypothetical protein
MERREHVIRKPAREWIAMVLREISEIEARDDPMEPFQRKLDQVIDQ